MQPDQDRVSVKIAPNNPVFDLPVIVAIEERLFAKAGLDVSFSATYADREKDNAAVLEALDRNKRHIRAEVARRVSLKFAPEIRFRIDERFDEAERIDRLLRTPQVRRDLDNDSGEPE